MSSVVAPLMHTTQMQAQQQPVINNTLNTGINVKQERPDEAEINDLAAKMKEQHKAAKITSTLQQPAVGQRTIVPPTTVGQTNILNYLTRKTTPTTAEANKNGTGVAKTNGTDVANGENAEKKPCDEESIKGHFGWATFGRIHIPYILRQTEKYCAVRMVEMKLLNKYLNYLHQDVYSCACVRSYFITEAESRLLNEINHKHCDAQFGRDNFSTTKDCVVRLSDANKFYQFLDICYKKLMNCTGGPSDKCGFIRINKESVVPYTVRDNQKYVPLFYFEGETDNLKLKADYLSGWDLSYLKFCCKVQGIRNELFASDSVAVISLTDIKSYFPTGTEFEDYWPSKVVDSQLLVGSKTPNSSIHWTKQPAQPPQKIVNMAPKHNVRNVLHQAAAAQRIQQAGVTGLANVNSALSATQVSIFLPFKFHIYTRTHFFFSLFL